MKKQIEGYKKELKALAPDAQSAEKNVERIAEIADDFVNFAESFGLEATKDFYYTLLQLKYGVDQVKGSPKGEGQYIKGLVEDLAA